MLDRREDLTPIHVRLAAILRAKLQKGHLVVGAALPAEREMLEKTALSRVTMRKAIDLLMCEGLLSRKQGSGTYVAPRIEQPQAPLAVEYAIVPETFLPDHDQVMVSLYPALAEVGNKPVSG